MFYEVLMEKSAAKKRGAKLTPEYRRISSELDKHRDASPTHQSLMKLRNLGTGRLPNHSVGDTYHEYKQGLKPAELRRAKKLEAQIHKEEAPFRARLAKTAEKKKKKRSGALSHMGTLAGAGGGAVLGSKMGAGTALGLITSKRMDPKYIPHVMLGSTALGAGVGSGLGGGDIRGVAGGTAGALAGGLGGAVLGRKLKPNMGGEVYGGLIGAGLGGYAGNRLARKD